MIHKFGRLVSFDERSRDFPIRALIRRGAKARSYTWSCPIVLDQKDQPACTGFSVSHEAAARPAMVKGITNQIAQKLYKRAQQLDEWQGENYDGSSVLGAMKAAVEKGWYGQYRWAFGIDDVILSLGYKGPGVVGINWYEGMNNVDNRGFICPTGKCLGGHAILVNGVNIKNKCVKLHNSWGKTWGIDGECYLSFTDFDRLLHEQGEFAIPIIRKMS